VIFIGFSVLLSVCTQYICAVHCNTIDFQTAKDVRADQDTLFEMFERIEAFFRRLNIYTEVAPNEGMVDTITAIMVEVLNVIGMVTKEMMQGRTSKRSVTFKFTNKFPADKALFRKISEATDRKERYRGCVETARQADARGGTNGCCTTPEGHKYDR